jgi:hypothetical protein
MNINISNEEQRHLTREISSLNLINDKMQEKIDSTFNNIKQNLA